MSPMIVLVKSALTIAHATSPSASYDPAGSFAVNLKATKSTANLP